MAHTCGRRIDRYFSYIENMFPCSFVFDDNDTHETSNNYLCKQVVNGNKGGEKERKKKNISLFFVVKNIQNLLVVWF